MPRMYANGAYESANFIEVASSPAEMRMFSNNAVQVIQIVETSGAQNKLHSNGTFVSSQFIEV